jgi:hypothetical protein
MKLQRRLFCFWTDDNLMSNDRLNALSSIKNSDLEVIFINGDALSSWLVDDAPLHPAYKYLSSVHKADYLRCYFMHHYGGAYSDIKILDQSWLSSYEELNNSNYLVSGYKELSVLDTARGRGFMKDIWLASNFFRIIGCGAFICKPNTSFTTEWLKAVHKILDCKYDLLAANPAQNPRDHLSRQFINKHKSKYPLRWTEICGEVFHPLSLRYSRSILKNLPPPDFNQKYL